MHDRPSVTRELNPLPRDRHAHERRLEKLLKLQGTLVRLAVARSLYLHAHDDSVAHVRLYETLGSDIGGGGTTTSQRL